MSRWRRGRAYAKLFGPDKIPGAIHEFLNWFVIRKVLEPEWIADEAELVGKELLTWLDDMGYVDTDEAQDALEAASEAAKQLPGAERLSRFLYDLTEKRVTEEVMERIDAVDQIAQI